MPDDRFADLGPRREQGDSEPSAAEQLAELDARDPELERRRIDPRSTQRRYAWVVGVAAVILIVVVGVKTVPHAGAGAQGPPLGTALPHFAAPEARGALSGDPNIKQSTHDRTTSNRTPACDVHGAGVVNICDLAQRPLVLTFVDEGPAPCDRYLDRLAALSSDFPQVAFAAVVSGRSKAQVAKLARAYRWSFPVAVDDNAALLDLYHMPPVCATTTFAYRGGVVRANKILAQKMTDAALRAEISATITR